MPVPLEPVEPELVEPVVLLVELFAAVELLPLLAATLLEPEFVPEPEPELPESSLSLDTLGALDSELFQSTETPASLIALSTSD